MPSKFRDINNPRIDKMIKMIETIETSAKSNKTEDEMPDLFVALFQKLAPYAGGEQPISIATEKASENDGNTNKQGNSTAGWFNLRQAAIDAPIEQLTPVMAVIMNRVDELIHDSVK